MLLVQDNDASRNTSAEEKICRKSDDSLYNLFLNKALSDYGLRFSLLNITTEQNAVRKDYRTLAIGLK